MNSKSFELQRIHSLGFGETKPKCEHVFVRWSPQLNASGEDPLSQTSVKRQGNKPKTLRQDLPQKETKNAHKLLEAIKTKIEDNDLGHLQGKLAELSTLLTTIQARQQEVLDNAATSNAKVATMEKDWIEVRNEYKKMADAIKGFEDSVSRFKKEVDDLWKGLDAASSPLG